MKKPNLWLALAFTAITLSTQITNAQSVGINTVPAASAALDVSSTTKGILVPRMTSTQRNDIASPASGLMIYDLTLNSFYFYNGTAWTAVTATSVPVTQLPNFYTGHTILSGSTVFYTTPFGVTTGALVPITSFYISTNAKLNVTFYSFDDEGLTFELFQIMPVANSSTYTTTGSALATCNTGIWSSGAPTTASFSYTATAGNMYSIKITKTGGGAFTTAGGLYTSFYAN